MEINYIKLPLTSIPFEEIPSLEKVDYQYVCCSYFSLSTFMNLDYYLLSVYDAFNSNDLEEIAETKLLFGRVISEAPSKRGVNKVAKVGNIEKDIQSKDLPYLKYSNNKQIDGNWFYVKEGKYFAFSAHKSNYEQVYHLEGISLYGDIILRLRVVVELLKRNIKKGLLTLTEKQFKDIAFKVLRSESSTKKLSDEEIQNGVNNWIPSMLMIPLFEEIPEELKERIKAL